MTKTKVKRQPKYDFIYCRSCNYGCKYEIPPRNRKATAIAVGAGQGAAFGSRVGIAAGPLGAISGLIPGAIVGAILGAQLADATKHDPKCPKCGTRLPLSEKLRSDA